MLLNRERALAVMEKYGLDALVATTPENVHYLSDYGTQHSYNFAPWGISCAILPRDEAVPATLIVHEFEVPAVAESPSWMPELRAIKGVSVHLPTNGNLTEAEQGLRDLWASVGKNSLGNRQRMIGQTLVELGLASNTLGFDDARAMLELREHELSGAQTLDATNILREIRLVKTPKELERLTHASRINQSALTAVANLVVEGVTCGELIRYYRSSMAAQGGYGSHVTGGGHDRPWLSYWNTAYRLKRGDIIHLDPAGWYDHYWADQGRTGMIGPTSEKFEEFYAVLQECHRVVDPMLQPRTSSAAIRSEARRIAEKTMPKEGFVPLVHSIGIEQYDHPQTLGEFLSEDFVFEKGMVVNFETIYFELGFGSLQLEDSYLIDDGGPHRLGTLPQEPFRR